MSYTLEFQSKDMEAPMKMEINPDEILLGDSDETQHNESTILRALRADEGIIQAGFPAHQVHAHRLIRDIVAGEVENLTGKWKKIPVIEASLAVVATSTRLQELQKELGTTTFVFVLKRIRS